MKSKGTCVALVCNRAYLDKALLTIWQLRIFGRFSGDVVLVIGDDLREAIGALRQSLLRIIPVYFPDIQRSFEDRVLDGARSALDSQSKKTFQFHKFFCFSPFFKKWNRVLYLDAKMRIYAPLGPLLEVDCTNSLVAHSDAYPDFEWTLTDQFNFADFPELRQKLSKVADLGSDYFQTTMMYYDTAIIEDGTVGELIELSRMFPNSRTNDQGIVNIWAQKKGIWKKLPTEKQRNRFLYDFHERPGYGPDDYLMVKYPKISRKDVAWFLSAKAFDFFRRMERRRVDSQSPIT
jgi:lipopolysaccharide biosynthesis glycosyltransferase